MSKIPTTPGVVFNLIAEAMQIDAVPKHDCKVTIIDSENVQIDYSLSIKVTQAFFHSKDFEFENNIGTALVNSEAGNVNNIELSKLSSFSILTPAGGNSVEGHIKFIFKKGKIGGAGK